MPTNPFPWQIIKRDSKEHLLLGLHLYIQDWHLKNELSNRAKIYDNDLQERIDNKPTPTAKQTPTADDIRLPSKNNSNNTSSRHYALKRKEQQSTNSPSTPLMMHHILDSV
ncbi:hypothetical protein JTB14_004365 [Gonioctena quinquepunctata]|nr:hypothetical protein JTB14_004365 [Gonioctena quinquepunctata]